MRSFSLVSGVRAGAGVVGGVMCGARWRRGVVSAERVRGVSGRGPLQLQDVWLRLLEAFEGAKEALLEAGDALICEVEEVSGRGYLGPATEGS